MGSVVLPNYDLMRGIERRYRQASGLTDRASYSILYGPLASFPVAMINENPGGTPENYKIVNVMAGEHEYVEGRSKRQHDQARSRSASTAFPLGILRGDPADAGVQSDLPEGPRQGGVQHDRAPGVCGGSSAVLARVPGSGKPGSFFCSAATTLSTRS